MSTSFLPALPSPAARPPTFKAPRGGKGKFKDSLGGLLEEEGEEVIAIARAPDRPPGEEDEGGRYWAVLGREEISIWTIRVRLSGFYLLSSSFEGIKLTQSPS